MPGPTGRPGRAVLVHARSKPRSHREGSTQRASWPGLGLTLTEAIAVAHHGHVRVVSTVGEGAAFTLEPPHSR